MKKMIALAVALLMVVCSLAACGGSGDSSGDATEKPTAFVGTTKDVDLSIVVNNINQQFDLGEMREVNDSDRYYGISPTSVNQFYAQKPVSDREFNELVICEASAPDAVPRIEARLNKALDSAYNSAKSYSKDDLAMIEKCKVVSNGKYIYLVISPDAEAICALIENAIN